MPTNNRENLVQSDETLFQIVDVIHARGTAGVTEIANEIGKSSSTVHKHLKTLDVYDFVHNDGGEYRLGLKFLYYGGRVRDTNFFFNEVWPKVNQLAKETEKLAAFQVRESDYTVMLYLFNDEYNLRQVAPVGDRCLLHQSAAGQAMLAQLPDSEIESYADRTGLPKSTEKTIDNTQDLFKRIASIRKQGYTVSHGERIEGLLAVSAPILDSQDRLYGAVSLTEPVAPQADNDVDNILVEPLLNIVNDIRLKLTNRNDRTTDWS